MHRKYIETERRILVDREQMEGLVAPGAGMRIEQFYLTGDPQRSVRVRIVNDSLAILTIKGPKVMGSGLEVEQEIAIDKAHALRGLIVGKAICKTRHDMPLAGGLTASIDLYESPRRIAIAEIELDDINAPIGDVAFLGREITHEKGYSALDIAMDCHHEPSSIQSRYSFGN